MDATGRLPVSFPAVENETQFSPRAWPSVFFFIFFCFQRLGARRGPCAGLKAAQRRISPRPFRRLSDDPIEPAAIVVGTPPKTKAEGGPALARGVHSANGSLLDTACTSWHDTGRALFFSNISEHADAQRRGAVSIRRHVRTCLTETFPMPPSDLIQPSVFAVGVRRKVAKNRSSLGPLHLSVLGAARGRVPLVRRA